MASEVHNTTVDPKFVRLGAIFTPYAVRQQQEVYRNRTRFVHYTSAEAALSIIEKKRLWMRNATSMSDYREVRHGYQILDNFFSVEGKKKAFVDAIDACVPGAATEAMSLFDDWREHVQLNTYITSISEHDNREDLNGRLSMWRAYGGSGARVAIVLKVPDYSGGAAALNLIFSPVAYLNEEGAHKVIHEVVENIRAEREFLSSVDRSLVVRAVRLMLLAGVTCLKHEGFHEEREWRAIYSPRLWPSALMKSSTKTVGAVPQTVFEIPLDAAVSDSLRGLDLFAMLDRIIIGPSAYPWVLYDTFTAALGKAGVPEAGRLVFTSQIPIRT